MASLQGGETTVAARWIYGKISALVGSVMVYPAVASRNAAMPYVVYQFMPNPEGADTRSLGGGRAMSRLRFLVKVIAATQAEAEPIVRLVDTALRGEGPQNDYYISSTDRFEPFELAVVEGDELYWQIGGYYDVAVTAI